MLFLLVSCARPTPVPVGPAPDTGDAWSTDSAPPDPEDPRVVFLDPGSGEVHGPTQSVRVEILTGDDAPMEALSLVWTGVAEGISGLPTAPDESGKASFSLDPLPQIGRAHV